MSKWDIADMLLMLWLIAAILIVLGITVASGQTKLPCSVESQPGIAEQQSWRMIDGKKCWYIGPRKLPKEQLFWPASEPSKNRFVEHEPPEWLQPPRTDFQDRWDALYDMPTAQNPVPITQWKVFGP